MDFETKVVGNVKFFEWNMCGCMQNIKKNVKYVKIVDIYGKTKVNKNKIHLCKFKHNLLFSGKISFFKTLSLKKALQ